jgi:cyclin H
MHLSEDDIYRRSTQYRYWSFTPTQLASQRQATNAQASQRVQSAFAVARERALEYNTRLQRCTLTSGSSTNNDPSTQSPVPVPVGRADCLTVAKEQRLVNLFCQSALGLGHFLNLPIEVSVSCAKSHPEHLISQDIAC